MVTLIKKKQKQNKKQTHQKWYFIRVQLSKVEVNVLKLTTEICQPVIHQATLCQLIVNRYSFSQSKCLQSYNHSH